MYCYCKQIFTEAFDNNEIPFTALQNAFSDGSNYCETWVYSYVGAQVIILLVPMLIIFINFVAKKFLWFSGRFERKHSLAAETYASTRNMALLSIINTGFILLIANYDFGYDIFGLNLLQGGYGKFNSSWYRVVGA